MWDLELPSYINDLCLGVSIWDKIMAKGIDMGLILDEADKIVNRIALENHLLREDSKHECIIVKTKSRKKNKKVK